MLVAMSRHPVRAALLALSSLLLVSASGPDLRTGLERVLLEGVVPADLVITYDAMHPFHGGVFVEVQGDGLAQRRSRSRGDLRASIRQVELSEAELLGLVALLVELEAWEQREPARPPLPDEGRAELRVALGDQEGGFWEWYNEMGRHDRMLRVSTHLTQLVPR
jgi:hypothetical protein